MLNKIVLFVCLYYSMSLAFVQAASDFVYNTEVAIADLFDAEEHLTHLSCLPTCPSAAPAENPSYLSHIKKQIKKIRTEEVTFFVQQDGYSSKKFMRKGILVRRPDAKGTVLICHGYLNNKHDAIILKHLFPFYNVMSFDFRAHGELVDGQMSTIGRDEAFDVMGAVDFIKTDSEMKNKPVIAYGFSMGAVAAIEAQAQNENLFDAMILDCPFDSTDHAMSRGLEEKMKISFMGRQYSIPGKQFILDHMYDDIAQILTNFLFQRITSLDSNKVATKFVKVTPIESIKKITVPCYFVHCENDKKVPIEAIESLYKNKPGYKRLWITQGTQHFGSYAHNPEMYWYKVNKFLNKYFAGNLDLRKQERVCDQRTININISLQ